MRQNPVGTRVDEGHSMAKSSKRPQDSPSYASSSSATGNYDRNRVAARAYELYMQRGRSDGADLEDWLTAEREYRAHGDSDTRDE
jgi:hypothetical protein